MPPVIGLVFANGLHSFRALKLQFFVTFSFIVWGLSSDLGSGIALILIILSFVDLLIFAPKQAYKSAGTHFSALGMLIFSGVFLSGWDISPTGLLPGPGFLTIIPLFVQISFGLYRLRFYEAAQTTSEHQHSIIDTLALKTSDELALIVDQSGRVASVGVNINKILGTSDTFILGRGLFERLHPVDRPAFLIACSQSHEPRTDLPLRLMTGETETSTLPLCYALFTARIIPISVAGTGTCLIMLREVIAQHTIDLSFQASKTGEKPLTENDALTRAKLLSEISHDVRTPLNAIMGFSELLSDLTRQPKSAGAIAEYGQIIHRSSKDLLDVVTHLIDLTRLENGVFKIAPEVLAPKDVLEQLGEQIALKLDISSLDFSVTGVLHNLDWTVDRRAARQILTTVAVALLTKTRGSALKVDVSVVNSTLCFTLSCPKNMSDVLDSWQSKPVAGLHISLEIAHILAKLMGGLTQIKFSDSGKPIAEVHFPLGGASTIQGGTDLIHLSQFRDFKRKTSQISASNPWVKKHA